MVAHTFTLRGDMLGYLAKIWLDSLDLVDNATLFCVLKDGGENEERGGSYGWT